MLFYIGNFSILGIESLNIYNLITWWFLFSSGNPLYKAVIPFTNKIRIFWDNLRVSSARDDIEGIDKGSKLEVKDSDSFALANIDATSFSFALYSEFLSAGAPYWLLFCKVIISNKSEYQSNAFQYVE